MKSFIKLLIVFFRRLFFNPLLIIINVFIFFFLRFIFGPEVSFNFMRGVSSFCIPPILRLCGAKIGCNTVIQEGIFFHNSKNLKNLIIGSNCHVGKNLFVDLRDKITIGDNVVIAMNCELITHQDMTNSPLSKLYPPISYPIVIENGSYLGCNVTVLMGVCVGENTIIGSKSLVNENTETNCIYVGVPARKSKRIDAFI